MKVTFIKIVRDGEHGSLDRHQNQLHQQQRSVPARRQARFVRAGSRRSLLVPQADLHHRRRAAHRGQGASAEQPTPTPQHPTGAGCLHWRRSHHRREGCRGPARIPRRRAHRIATQTALTGRPPAPTPALRVTTPRRRPQAPTLAFTQLPITHHQERRRTGSSALLPSVNDPRNNIALRDDRVSPISLST